MDITWENLILLSHISASAIVALTGVVLYLLLKKKHLLPDSKDSKKITLILVTYLFGTVNFAMISQSLWQHGAVQLFTF